MTRTVLKFGLIGGGLSAATLLTSISICRAFGFGKSDVLGYTSIVLSALIVFFGVRSYRETVGGGRISFGRGLAVGVLITAIASLCYVAAFQVVYFKLMPDFGERYALYMVERVRASGAGPEAIEKVAQQAATIKRLNDQPLLNAALAFIEPFPIGLLVTAVSAALLRRR
jgi:Protein of unknown function (DUF4199)